MAQVAQFALTTAEKAAVDFVSAEYRKTGSGVSVPAIARHLQSVDAKMTRFIARRLVDRLVKWKLLSRREGGHASVRPARKTVASERREKPFSSTSHNLRPLNLWTIEGVEDIDFFGGGDRKPETVQVDLNMIPLKAHIEYFLVRMKSNDYTALRVAKGGVFVVHKLNNDSLPPLKRGKWLVVRVAKRFVGVRRVHKVIDDYTTRLVVRRFRAKAGEYYSPDEFDEHVEVFGMVVGAYTGGTGSNLRELYADKKLPAHRLKKLQEIRDAPFRVEDADQY